jgi:CDP-glucose 4,6-dehydratase
MDRAAVLAQTYRGRRVLVTGHTGFKGSWLAAWLSELGAEVAGYALDPLTARDNFVVSGIARRILDVRGDVREFDTLRRLFEDFKPEFVFHLAAQALVRKGYRDPRETFDTNVGGTVNVLENCRLCNSVRIIVNVTSDKCYENRERSRGYRESDPMGGLDPYGSSKGCSELVSAAYRASFFESGAPGSSGKALSTVRAGNVIGGGDWSEDRIVPDCIRSLEAGDSIKVRNPGSVRPWQFVLEPLGGYLLLGAKMCADPAAHCGPWNFGPERSSAITVGELVGLIIAEWGSGSWEAAGSEVGPREAGLLTLDISKARRKLGWSPRLAIKEAVKRTVEWYAACARGEDAGPLGESQIRGYMEQMSLHG